MGNPLHVAFPSFYRPRREAPYNLGPLPTRAFLSPLCASAAPRQFARLPRVSACGRKSSRHPPPPNRTSSGMCQRKRTRDFRPRRKTESITFLAASSKARPTVVGVRFTRLLRRHARSSALLRPYCMRLVSFHLRRPDLRVGLRPSPPAFSSACRALSP